MFILYAALVILASLNRETGLLLVGCYAAWSWGQKCSLINSVFLVGVWGIITLAMHLAYGSAPHVLGWLGTLQYNLKTLPEAMLSNLVLLPLWWMLLRSYPHAPAFLRRLAWCAAVYLGSVLVGAAWQEIRLLMTAFPLVLPLLIRDKSTS